MTARERRQVVEQMQAVRGVSERRAIRHTGFPRSTMRYRSIRDPQELLRARIVELAQERPRWGYRMIHVMLRREGRLVNRKRVQRLYREEGLAVRSKGRKRRSQAPRPIREALSGPNERWSMDFVSDTLSNGRRFRCLTIMDEFSRECLAIHVAHSIPAAGVIEVMERLKESRGLPDVIITDNGSEFRSRAFDSWAYARGVKLDFIQPGKPGPEWIHRELQRHTPRRMLKPALVPLDPGRETIDRAVASRLQRSSSPQFLGFSDSRGVYRYSFTERRGPRS